MIIDNPSSFGTADSADRKNDHNLGGLVTVNASLAESKAMDKNAYRIGFHLLASICVVVVAARLISPFFNAILFASVLAIVGMPLKKKIDEWRINPSLAALIVTVVILILMITPISLFTLDAVDSGNSYLDEVDTQSLGKGVAEEKMQQIFEDLKDTARPYLPESAVNSLNWTTVTTYAKTFARSVIDSALSFASTLPDTMLKLLLAGLLLFFLLRDGHLLVQWIAERIPIERESWDELKRTTYDTTLGATVGSFWAAFAQSALMAVAYLVLSIPGVVIAAGATFFLAWIPFLGSAPVWIVGLIYLAIQGLWVKFAALCVFAVVISLVDNVVRVMVVSKDVTMHPIVGLLAILGGIDLFGFVGVIIGPAFVALSLVYFDLFKVNKPLFKLF